MSLPGIQPTEDWEDIYWGMNLPLQMWPTGGDEMGNANAPKEWRVLNYMPRKESCKGLESTVTEAELPQFCKNTAIILRNLANLFEALGERKIDTIYYPDQTVEEAMKKEDDDV